jgi:ADP-heptose:LPS heptosyltransferase
MKILVMSLLRIGDVVLAAPILKALRDRHPEAEIHLMINSQFAQVSALMPYIDRTILFERDRLQKGLGEASIPLFDSYARLESFLDEVNGTGYDQAINLTHSRLSGWMMSLIDAKEKIGLALDGTGRASFGSNWFRYLNNQTDAEGREVFHFADVFKFGLQLDETNSLKGSLVETAKGIGEAETFFASAGGDAKPIVAVQALTSDTKKDWGLERFGEALIQFHRVHPAARIALLAAPFERERLAPLLKILTAAGVDAHLAVLGFEGAFSLLRKAKLLLTGDTSIKHLASAAGTPLIEICLGSSDANRTGAYRHGSIILQSREACAPCVHSKPCHREKQFCASRIPTEAVAMIASEVYAGRSFQLKTIAEEYAEEIEVLRVESRASGYWAAYSVLESFTEDAVGRWVDLTCRKIWLDRAQVEGLSTRGTETVRLSRLLRAIHPQTSEIEWRHMLGEFERQVAAVEGRLNGFKVGLRDLRGNYEDPRKMREYVRGLISFREKLKTSALLRSFKSALDQVIEDDISPPFVRFKRIVEIVGEIDKRTDIHLRLIRGLINEMEPDKGIEKTGAE